jgi:hypothetical protein
VQVLDELGRLVQLESTPSMATRSAIHRRSSSPVRYSQVSASSGVTVPQSAGKRLAISSRARAQRQARPVAVRRSDDALLDECGRIVGWQRASRKAHAGGGGPGQAIDAEGAPVLAPTVPGDEIPAPPAVDEGVRVDLAAALTPSRLR